jgi:hypothetical protein
MKTKHDKMLNALVDAFGSRDAVLAAYDTLAQRETRCAAQEKARTEAAEAVHAAIAVKCGSWTPDWDTPKTTKATIAYHRVKGWVARVDTDYRSGHDNMYLPSKALAEEIIKGHTNALNVMFGIGRRQRTLRSAV